VLNLAGFTPAPSLGAEDAARVEAATGLLDGMQNRLWLDAVLEGRYPGDVLERLSPALPEVIEDGDLEAIAAPLDFLGVNYYFDHHLAPGHGDLTEYPGGEGLVQRSEGPDVTATGWPVTPDGFRRMLVRVGREHPSAPPIVVTENGSAYDDEADPLDDPRRVAYLRRHLDALAGAVRDGADVRGYFAWSLMDNFEWAEGYTKRFGLARVDYGTLERRPRRSFETYRAIAAAQRDARP
jgi:beta-glucosidase